MTITELYAMHIDDKVSCAELDRRYGKHNGWTANEFKKVGLKPRPVAEANALIKGQGGNLNMRQYTKARSVRLPNERLRVRLVKRDGVYLVREIDDEGEPVGGGVPASPWEIALGMELHALLQRLEAGT